MNNALVEFFQIEVDKLFSFLVTIYKFSAPQLSVDEKIRFATIAYKGKHLTIQFILDEREEYIDCKIARVFAGMTTIHYQLDNQGILVRQTLSALLRRKGVRQKLYTKVTGLSLVQKIPITLADYERMLNDYGKDILADSPSALS